MYEFDQKEVDNAVVQEIVFRERLSYAVSYDAPIAVRENVRRAYKHEQLWIPTRRDFTWFCPQIIPDNLARAFVIQGGSKYQGPVGGKDMFGIEWEYVPSAYGSIVRPGTPALTDVTKWKEVIKFPNLDEWDWEGSAELNKDYLQNSKTYMNLCIFTGWFERLISFMDFGPAAYAFMNKKTKPYVKELFEAITDLWIQLIDKADKYYGHAGLDGFAFHDDWGSQNTAFFNEKLVQEMLVPYMKRVTDHCHELGYTAELHSCGKIDTLVGCIVDAGWDSWDAMAINDFPTLYEKYGDKLIMSVGVEDLGYEATKEEQIAEADRFTSIYKYKNKPIMTSTYIVQMPEFQKEVYKQSRLNFQA